MLQTFFQKNKSFLAWALAAGLLTTAFVLYPQINLWKARGENYNGIYTINAADEAFYASYIQSLIDDKPRRNSPYSGALDSPETPQKESILSIQQFCSYPLVIVAKIFGLSITGSMILLGILTGFMSAIALFWLLYLMLENGPSSFAATILILYGGSIAAGSGNNILDMFFAPDSLFTLFFTRRANPAVSFSVLFFFFCFVWKWFAAAADPAGTRAARIRSCAAAICCFAILVYTYYFHWTTALAWFAGLTIWWAIFRQEDLRRNLLSLAVFGGALLMILVPYFILLANRGTNTDSAQLLELTRAPDLFRLPEIISYAAIAFYLIAGKLGWLNLRDPKIIFLSSFALLAPIVFNQQIITGHSLQPFHYQFYSANYMAFLSILAPALIVLKDKLDTQSFHKILLIIGAVAVMIGYFDAFLTTSSYEKENIRRDKLLPVAERIKTITRQSPDYDKLTPSVILSFDLAGDTAYDCIDLPALTSQSVLWSPYLVTFPDMSHHEDRTRLYKFLYYQNFDKARLTSELQAKNGYLLGGLFGIDRVVPILTNKLIPVTNDEILNIAEDYDIFRRNFSERDAQSNMLSFVIVQPANKNDLSTIDRWYERNNGETVGDYILYRVKLRNQ